MPSAARKSFDANVGDIDRLLELHQQLGGTGKGRRYGLEVLNKSAIVLITSYWEAYCEDIAAEALAHIVKHAKTSDALPKELKKQLATEIKKSLHELEVWKLADDGWKSYLEDRLEKLQEQRNTKLNTPRSANIEQLFLSAIGIEKISSYWHWDKKRIPRQKTSMTTTKAKKKLDKFVTLRGAIAHRGKPSGSVKKADVDDYFDLIKGLAAVTGGCINTYVKSITGKPLWQTKVR